MKYITSKVSLILLCSLAPLRHATSAAGDYLEPVDPNAIQVFKKYRKILQDKLGPTPFDCGRALLIPPFDPEGSTSVYSVRRGGQTQYYVTDVSATENIWQRTDNCHFPERAKGVAIIRRDAELPQKTAQLVQQVWLRVLSGKYAPRQMSRPRGVLGVDSTFAEFSIELTNGEHLYGQLDFTFGFPGKITKPLVEIWNALYAYCKAAPENRPPLAKRIDQQSVEFLRLLDAH